MPTRDPVSGAIRVAIVADRLGWEECRLVEAGAAIGVELSWVNDESLGLGAPGAPALSAFDVVLVRSRSYTRGGLVAGLAESAGLRVSNTARAIRICENKAELRGLLQRAGIPVPQFRVVLSRRDFSNALDELGVPLVLKPIFGGMGKRVTLVRDADVAHSVYDYVEDLGHAFEQACLVEPFLDGGTSLRCLVIGTTLVGAAEFRSAGVDWRSNAALGNDPRGIAHDPDVVKIVDDVVAQLGPGIYGIDLFATGEGLVVNEVNHAPAFRALASVSGSDIPTSISRYLEELCA